MKYYYKILLFFFTIHLKLFTFLFAQTFTEVDIDLPGFVRGDAIWGNYDNDGDLDILVTGYDGSNYISKIYRNDGDNTFTDINAGLTGVDYSSADWGDYDNDGDLDILITGYSGSGNIFKIYRNDEDNVFTDINAGLSGLDNSTVAWGDYDNDGDLDIIQTGSYYDEFFEIDWYVTSIYSNDGNDIFTFSVSLDGVANGSVAWGDYDNDGDLDIILSGTWDSMFEIDIILASYIYRNDGNNTFTDIEADLTDVQYSSAAWGDYDNDGDLDIILSGDTYVIHGSSQIYRNDGNDIFIDINAPLANVYHSSVDWGDYDNDGDLDILLTGKDGSSCISAIYRNDGDDIFTEINTDLTGVYEGSAAWGDYDNDGNLDILISGFDINDNRTFKLYHNNGSVVNTIPAAPSGLSSNLFGDSITFSWNKSTDNETPQNGLTYNIRVGTVPGGCEIISPMADSTGLHNLPHMGNVNHNTNWTINISRVLPVLNVYWSVQAIDQNFAGSNWANEQICEISMIRGDFYANTACFGHETHFSDSSTVTEGQITGWKWLFGDGDSSLIKNPIHTYKEAGTYNVQLTVSSGELEHTVTKPVYVNHAPVADFIANDVCIGNLTNFINNSTIDKVVVEKCFWDFDDGNTFNGQNPEQHGYLNAGIYNPKLIIQAENGCSDSITKQVSVGNYPVAAISADGPLGFCSGDSVELMVGYNTSYTYQWLLNDVPLTKADSNKVIIKNEGDYKVQVINTFGNCGTISDIMTIKVFPVPPKPVIVVEGNKTDICPGEIITMNIEQMSSQYTYQWKRNGVPLDYGKESTLKGALAEGDYSVESSLSGCSSESDIQTITYKDAPEKPDIVAFGPNVWYLACSNDSALDYRWYWNNELIPGANKYTYVANQDLGVYCVAISDGSECYAYSDKLKIPELTAIDNMISNSELSIYPNPNNGLFKVFLKNDYIGKCKVDIYNSSGEKVFSSNLYKTHYSFVFEFNEYMFTDGLYLMAINIKGRLFTNCFIVNR